MAGRPSLRIGSHGKITRKYLGAGVWLARTRFRDSDDVTRIVERRGPADEHDHHGKLAEDVLMEALQVRRPPGAAGEISLDSRIAALVDLHLMRLEEDGKSPATMTTYRSTDRKLKKFIGGLRLGEATPARLDAVIRSVRTAHGANMARHGRTPLRGGLQLAVMANVLGVNPCAMCRRLFPSRHPRAPRRSRPRSYASCWSELPETRTAWSATWSTRSRYSLLRGCDDLSCWPFGGSTSISTRGRFPSPASSSGSRGRA